MLLSMDLPSLAHQRLSSIGCTVPDPNGLTVVQRVGAYRVYMAAHRRLHDHETQIQDAEIGERETYRQSLNPVDFWKGHLTPWLDDDRTLPHSLQVLTPVGTEEMRLLGWIDRGIPFILRRGWPFIMFSAGGGHLLMAMTSSRIQINGIFTEEVRHNLDVMFRAGDNERIFVNTPALPCSFQLISGNQRTYHGVAMPCIIDNQNGQGPFSLHPLHYRGYEEIIAFTAKNHASLKEGCQVVLPPTTKTFQGLGERVVFEVHGVGGLSFHTWPLRPDTQINTTEGVPTLLIDDRCCYLVSCYIGRLLGIPYTQTYQAVMGSNVLELDRTLCKIENTESSTNPWCEKPPSHVEVPRDFANFPGAISWSLPNVAVLFERIRTYVMTPVESRESMGSDFYTTLCGDPTEEKMYQPGTAMVEGMQAQCLALNLLYPLYASTRLLTFTGDRVVSNMDLVFDMVPTPPNDIVSVHKWAKQRRRSGKHGIPSQMFDAFNLADISTSNVFCRPRLYNRACAYISALTYLLYITDITPRTQILLQDLHVPHKFKSVSAMLESHVDFIKLHGFCLVCNNFTPSTSATVYCNRHKPEM